MFKDEPSNQKTRYRDEPDEDDVVSLTKAIRLRSRASKIEEVLDREDLDEDIRETLNEELDDIATLLVERERAEEMEEMISVAEAASIHGFDIHDFWDWAHRHDMPRTVVKKEGGYDIMTKRRALSYYL